MLDQIINITTTYSTIAVNAIGIAGGIYGFFAFVKNLLKKKFLFVC